MSNPNLEPTIKAFMELKRMREELDTEIANIEDEIKQAMGSEETLIAGAFKVDWKTVITSRIDTIASKKNTLPHKRTELRNNPKLRLSDETDYWI